MLCYDDLRDILAFLGSNYSVVRMTVETCHSPEMITLFSCKVDLGGIEPKSSVGMQNRRASIITIGPKRELPCFSPSHTHNPALLLHLDSNQECVSAPP